MKVRIDLHELIKFYDEDAGAGKHSNSIKTLAGEELAFALLVEHFKRQGATARRLNQSCTPGGRRGPWLDGWLRVDTGGNLVHYQVEVKSWSFHGFAREESLPVCCSKDALAEFKRGSWKRYWGDGCFSSPRLNKVLTPMKPPKDATTVEPLACLWSPLHPIGADEPLFEWPLDHPNFQRVWVFSMSAFARQVLCSQQSLEAELPSVHARMTHLNRLFQAA
jgi:hypothetical protein